jgi:hypothetical protein
MQGFLYKFGALLQPDREYESHGLSDPCKEKDDSSSSSIASIYYTVIFI